MATQKDIELAERFVETRSRKMGELKKRLKDLTRLNTPRWFEEVDAEESALRALIAHAKKTVPAEPQPGNPSETPNSSLPDPGPGYRLLSKDPPEDLQPGDDYRSKGEWLPSVRANEDITEQDKCYYRRKIETANTSETPNSSLPFHNPANADDYNTMHDYFGK